MQTFVRRTLIPFAAAALVLALGTAGPTGLARADTAEQIVNGTFDNGTTNWWATGNLALDAGDHRLCTDVPGGTGAPWDAIIGQNDIALVAGESYTFSFSASASGAKVVKALIQLPVDPWTAYLAENVSLGTDAAASTFTFTAPVDEPHAQVAFQIGGASEGWRFCMDDVSLAGGAAPPVYVPDTGPRVRVNQLGYLPHGPKDATLVTEATHPLPFQVVDAGGRVVFRGLTRPGGVDSSSGQNVHTVAFDRLTRPGRGYTVVADGETSRPFDVDAGIYQSLRLDALKFFYPQRSGIEILDSLRPGYARPAGHVGVGPNQGDTDVPCQPGVCDYRLDVSGGWYDAGDHGKYVVNGGIAVYQLMSEYERSRLARTGSPSRLRDGTLALPESGNGVPDILDEARWELEFLLKMQVPAGQPLAGMAHHKVHDETWTGLPLLPNLDDRKRELHPPTTAATLNLAAVAAQAARLYTPYDRAFARRALTAARTAWSAALAHPDQLADPSDGNGGGTYDDADVSDEFYWAAAELYLTTGGREFRDFLLASPLHTADVFGERGFAWGQVAALGRLDLATVPNRLPDRARVRRSVVAAAGQYLATLRAHPYGVPYAPADNRWDWGSNSQILNNLVVVATAYDLTGRPRFRDGVLEGVNYLFGRNALNQSYVTGYGEVSSHNQHNRWYAHSLDPALPSPPAGTLAGGPNSSIQDPVAARKLAGCPPQFCYLDDVESWSTNELAINWNSALAWVAGWVADQGGGSR